MTRVSFARRLTDLAEADPDRPALSCGEARLTRRELDDAATALAHDLAARGVGTGDMVTIALPNSVEWFVAMAAAWKLGATPQPVSSYLPVPELRAIVDLADPRVTIGVAPAAAGDRPSLPADHRPEPPAGGGVSEPLPDAVSPAWKAPTSGGSTGRPKLIVSGERSLLDPEAPGAAAAPAGRLPGDAGPALPQRPDRVVVPGAAAGAATSCVLPRFDAEDTLAAIEAHRAEVVYLVPTMMKRIWRLPAAVRDRYDLSSLRTVWHLAEPCPPWLKEAWIAGSAPSGSSSSTPAPRPRSPPSSPARSGWSTRGRSGARWAARS